MKRKIMILTIAFLSSVLMCANAFAAATGRCGDSIKWTLDDSGNLTLSGSGEMWNYGYDDSPFKDYGIKTVTIGDGITSIGNCVFYGCRGLTELTLPNSVTSIGNSSFRGCTGLTELTLPNSVTSIGYSSFRGCTGLAELTLPNSVTSIGNYAFGGCSGLTELILPNSVTSIGLSAFRGCSGLTELTLPDSVASIGDCAFSDCSGLSKITSFAEIPPMCGREVFDGVNKTNCELIVPEGSVAAYKQARGWKEFSNIRGVVAFGHCGDSITWTLYDSGNLTLSGSGEMWDYGYDTSPFKDYVIKTVTIGDGITSIGEYAFVGCSGLTELTLPNSVTSIGRGTFVDCSGLTELTLPSSVTSIGNSAFSSNGLEKITVESGNSRYDSRDNCNSIIETETNTLIAGCKNSIIPNSVTSIGDYAFSGCSGLTELTLPSSVTGIGDSAFAYCSGLTELTLPNSVTSIGDNAFEACSGLTELTLPNSVTSIGKYAFWYCTGLTKLTLSHSVTSIGNSAFEDCIGLEKVTSFAEIPPVCSSNVFDGVNKINCELIVPIVSVVAYKQARGWNEFSNITAATVRCGDSITWTLDDLGNLTLSGSGEMWNYGYDDSPFKDYGIKTVTIGDGITSIGNCVFYGCRGLTELTLPNSITSIGESAFDGCSGLTKLTLPNSVTSIGTGAFAYCSGLTELTLPNSVTSIGESAFKGCSGLTELTLPNSVTSIGERAFEGCTGLTELTLPNSVTSIGTGTFADCSGMTELTLPNGVTSIEESAFQGCSGLAKITSLAEIPPVCGSGVFDGVNKTNCELIVPIVSVIAYKQAEVWNEFSNIKGFSGVEVTMADGNTIRVIGNQIEISGYFTSVEVYGINGALIYKGKDNVVTVPSAGIYLVHVAGKTRKIVVE